MSSDVDFETAEWTLLKELPFKVILAAVVADVRGPLGAARKEMALGARELVKSATSEYTDNGLVTGVLADVADDPATEEEISLDDDEARQAAIVEAIALSSQANAILTDHTAPGESAAYMKWIYDAAEAAIKATRSGGFLGLRTSAVSSKEQDFLEQLRVALGIPPAEEPETE